jgi:hypothetical protein
MENGLAFWYSLDRNQFPEKMQDCLQVKSWTVLFYMVVSIVN